jgi:hypothetical protein
MAKRRSQYIDCLHLVRCRAATRAGAHRRPLTSMNKSAAAATNRRGQRRSGLWRQERRTQAQIAAGRCSRANRGAAGHHKETMPRAVIRPAAGRAPPVRLVPARISIQERGMERLGAAGRMSRARRQKACPLPMASAVFARQKAGPPWVQLTYRTTRHFFNRNLWCRWPLRAGGDIMLMAGTRSHVPGGGFRKQASRNRSVNPLLSVEFGQILPKSARPNEV